MCVTTLSIEERLVERSPSWIALSHDSHVRVFWSDEGGDLREHQNMWRWYCATSGQSCQLSPGSRLPEIFFIICRNSGKSLYIVIRVNVIVRKLLTQNVITLSLLLKNYSKKGLDFQELDFLLWWSFFDQIVSNGLILNTSDRDRDIVLWSEKVSWRKK